MTAPESTPSGPQPRREHAPAADEAVEQVDRTCRAAIDGRRAARSLAAWAKPYELSEPEFQLLWSLRRLVNGRVDQTSLARQLALSPAQVSATVERLRCGGWLGLLVAPGDRRRHCWQLSEAGYSLLAKMLVDREQLSAAPVVVDLSGRPNIFNVEKAA